MIRLVKKITAYLALAALLLPTLMLVAPSGARAANNLDVTIDQPLNNGYVSNGSTLQISGAATSSVAVTSLDVYLKDITTNMYWDDSATSWVPLETSLPGVDVTNLPKWMVTGGVTPTIANAHEYVIMAEVTDADSDTASTQVKLTGDNIAPVTVITSPENETRVSSKVSIEGTASDNLSSVSKVEVRPVGATSWVTVTGTEKWSYEAIMPNSVQEGGKYVLEFRATDKASVANVEPTPKTITLIKDTKAPIIGITHYPANNTVDYDSTVVFRGVSEPGTLMTLLINSDPIEQKTVAVSSGEWRFEVPASQIGAGQHDVTITATDTADNSLQMHFTFSVADEVVPVAVETASTQPTLAVASSTASAQSQTVGSTSGKNSTDEFKEDVENTAEGIIKAAETEDDSSTSPWQTVVTVIAILIIAIGVGTVGYYGYEWWATKEQMAINNAVAALEEKSEATVAKKTNGSKKNGTSKKKTNRRSGRRSSSRW